MAVASNRDLYEGFHAQGNVSDRERTSSGKLRSWLRLIDTVREGVFVDIGCGDGTVTTEVASKAGGFCIGLDLSKEASRRFTGSAGPGGGLDYVLCDATRVIPLRDNCADHIFCSDLFEHLQDVDGFLDEVWRVLKPGGYCVLSTPNLAWLPNRALLLFGLHPFWVELSYRYEVSGIFAEPRKFPAGHVLVFSTKALVKLLRLHSFEVERVLGTYMIDGKTLKRWGFSRPVGLAARFIDRVCALRPSWSAETIVRFHKPGSYPSVADAG